MNKAFITVCLVLLACNRVHAASYTLLGDELIGATNVDVGGVQYDVQFLAGSCISLFNGCDSASDFATDGGFANLASTALIDQVFNLDDVFDEVPGTTRGCGADISSCIIGTPFSLLGSGNYVFWSAINNPGSSPDSVFSFSGVPGSDLDTVTFAIWTPVSAVPVPAAFWLFGTALFGLVGFSKRRKSA